MSSKQITLTALDHREIILQAEYSGHIKRYLLEESPLEQILVREHHDSGQKYEPYYCAKLRQEIDDAQALFYGHHGVSRFDAQLRLDVYYCSPSDVDNPEGVSRPSVSSNSEPNGQPSLSGTYSIPDDDSLESRPRPASGESSETEATSCELLATPSILTVWHLQIVNQVMTYLRTVLAQHVQHQQRPATGEQPSKSGTSNGAAPGISDASWRCGNKRTIGQVDTDGDDDIDEEDVPRGGGGDGDGGGPNHNTVSNVSPVLRLACPYHKRNSRKYGVGACATSSWVYVRRLKEHIYRVHRLPISCPRCQASFSDQAMLSEHLLLPDRCERKLQTGDAPEGCTWQQEKALRDKKRRPNMGENEKWVETYRILFPNDTKIPTPYFERWEDTRDQEIAQARHELLHLVRQGLEAAVVQLPTDFQEYLKAKLERIFNDAQREILQRYQPQDAQHTRRLSSSAELSAPCDTMISVSGCTTEPSSSNSATNLEHRLDPELTTLLETPFDFSNFFRQSSAAAQSQDWDEEYGNPHNLDAHQHKRVRHEQPFGASPSAAEIPDTTERPEEPEVDTGADAPSPSIWLLIEEDPFDLAESR
ncbi:hypothetical protein QBC43DRAFT_326177 [Cladorrhinum sp. PSN259]|nr:hypothetical protein QBC43DRAFT_326177 [Cladorrhinum sp. PSN259]